MRTIPYRHVDGHDLHLWVYDPPAGTGPAPLVLDLHGGAWTDFSPAVDWFWCERLATAGFVVASAEVRLSGTAPWPACLDDARAAARWLRAEGATIGGDPTHVGAVGASTGGQLALVAATTPDEAAALDWVVALWPVVDVPGRDAMVRAPLDGDIAAWLADRLDPGPRAADDGAALAAQLHRLDDLRRRVPGGETLADAVQRANHRQGRSTTAQALLFRRHARAHDATFPAGRAQMRAASPLDIVRSGRATALPPLLVVQGDVDPNTTTAMARAYVEAYAAAGGLATLEIAIGLGHAFGNIPSRAADALVDRIATFARGRRPTRDRIRT